MTSVPSNLGLDFMRARYGIDTEAPDPRNA